MKNADIVTQNNSNKKSIIIDISFNIDRSKCFEENTPMYYETKELFRKSQKEEWIRIKIGLLMKYTIKSLLSQTYKGFIVVIRSTEETIDIINNVLGEYDKLPDNIVFTTKAEEIFDKQIETSDKLYRVVINNEDNNFENTVERFKGVYMSEEDKERILRVCHIH